MLKLLWDLNWVSKGGRHLRPSGQDEVLIWEREKSGKFCFNVLILYHRIF